MFGLAHSKLRFCLLNSASIYWEPDRHWAGRWKRRIEPEGHVVPRQSSLVTTRSTDEVQGCRGLLRERSGTERVFWGIKTTWAEQRRNEKALWGGRMAENLAKAGAVVRKQERECWISPSRLGKSCREHWGGTARTWWQELPGANEEKMKGRGNFQTSGWSKQWPESRMNRIQDALWSYYPRVSPRLAVLTPIGSLLEIRTCQSHLTYWIRICIFTRSPEIQICTRILEAPLSIPVAVYRNDCILDCKALKTSMRPLSQPHKCLFNWFGVRLQHQYFWNAFPDDLIQSELRTTVLDSFKSYFI